MPHEGVVRPFIGVAAFVCRDGKFLMQQRKGAHGEGTWSTPGGHLEFGETFQECAAREVKEETGMEIQNVRIGTVTNDIFKDDNKHYVTIWLVSDWKSGEPSITEPDKCIDQRWINFESLPDPLFLPWKQLLGSEGETAIRNLLGERQQA
jgi:8-oxo-dGTP diphosphatase